MDKKNIKTLTVTNFSGILTRYRTGDINSGKAFYDSSWGYYPFVYPPALTFAQQPTSIKGSVVTDLIVAGKTRIESGVTYTYAIGHTGRLYKIQVNDPTTYNADYDNPVLLTTLTNSQTFAYGGSLDFYQGGGTEKIWIGHDAGMTKINFDGTGETNLIGGSWVTNVPRIQKQFAGKIYITNSSNIAEIDSTEAVITYTKLSPGFPANTQARDIDVVFDGRYLVITTARSPLGSILSTSPTLSDIASDAYTFYWNGVDTGASSFNSSPNFTQNAFHTFGSNSYSFGNDITGGILQGANKKIATLLFALPPLPNAVGSSGDFLGWMQAEGANGQTTTNMTANFMLYGALDTENPTGLFRQMRLGSTLSNGDVLRIPFMVPVSNEQFAGPSSGYTITPVGLYNTGTGKSYFSTIEYNGTTTGYDLYSFKNAADYLSASCAGNYDTQIQFFSQKQKPTQVRVYFDAAAGNESFTVGLLGSNGTVLSGTSKTLTPSAGETRLEYTPASAPTYALGLRITNVAGGFIVIKKVEIDYTPYGN